MTTDEIGREIDKLGLELRSALLKGRPTADLHAKIEALTERAEAAQKAEQEAAARAAAAEEQSRSTRLETAAERISIEAHARLRALLARLAPPNARKV